MDILSLGLYAGILIGLLLAMIQSMDETGAVRVTAQADGLEPASIDITVVPGEAPPRVQ